MYDWIALSLLAANVKPPEFLYFMYSTIRKSNAFFDIGHEGCLFLEPLTKLIGDSTLASSLDPLAHCRNRSSPSLYFITAIVQMKLNQLFPIKSNFYGIHNSR